MNQPSPDEAREPTPVQMFWKDDGFKNFTPRVLPADATEVAEVEETLTPAPKDSSAPVSAISPELPPVIAPDESEIPVPHEPSPTELLEAAAKASGKDSASSAVDSPIPTTTQPAQEPSSQSSSSETPTKSGSAAPPVPVQPPTSSPTPTQ